MSDVFSPIMMAGALVFPETICGMIEQSATRKPLTPCTRNRSSTTAIGSAPILQVPVGWKMVVEVSRAQSSSASSLASSMSGPGACSAVTSEASGSARAMRLAMRIPSTSVFWSLRVAS